MLRRAARPRCAKEIGIKKEEQRAHKVGRQGRRERQREKRQSERQKEREEMNAKRKRERKREKDERDEPSTG